MAFATALGKYQSKTETTIGNADEKEPYSKVVGHRLLADGTFGDVHPFEAIKGYIKSHRAIFFEVEIGSMEEGATYPQARVLSVLRGEFDRGPLGAPETQNQRR